MTEPELSDEETRTLIEYARRKFAAERWPMSPALRPVRATMETLDPKPEPQPLPVQGKRVEPSLVPGSPSWLRLARLAKVLASLTLVWLGIEGTVGVIAGILAGSIALIAFGLDSAIEGLASIIVIWRFSGTRTISPDAERRAQKWVAVSFYLLAPYVAAEAIETLIDGAAAETSWLGIGLTAGTLLLCPWLGLAKQRIAEKLGSRATYGEGTQNLLCALLAGAVLIGLATNSLFGLWWLDPTIALLIAAICVREGYRAWQGEQCGCTACTI